MYGGVRKIYIDMDGVLADFVGASYAIHNRDINLNPPTQYNYWRDWPVPDEVFWLTIKNAGVGFWESLPACRWAADLIAAIDGIAPWSVCSKPTLSPECQAGKMRWLRNFFHGGFDRFHFTPDKHELARSGRLLIDDSDDNVKAFREAGGMAILFPQPWNENQDKSNDAIGFTIHQLELYDELEWDK